MHSVFAKFIWAFVFAQFNLWWKPVNNAIYSLCNGEHTSLESEMAKFSVLKESFQQNVKSWEYISVVVIYTSI